MNSPQDKTFRDYISDIGLYGIVHFLLPFTGLLTLPLITKFLGVSAYGIYTLVLTTMGILVYFIHLMFPSGLVRFLAGEKDKKTISSTFISALLVALLAEVVVALLMLSLSGMLASNIFHDINAKVYIYLIVIAVFFEASASIFRAYFRILEQIKRYLIYEVLFELIRIGLIAAAVFFGHDVLHVLLAVLLTKVINSGLFLVILLREQGWANPDLKMVKPYLAFGIPLIVPQLMAWVISLSDRYFISYFCGAEAVGIYSAAYGLPSFIGGVNDAIWFVFLPIVFRLWNAGSYEEVKRYFTAAVKLFALFGIPGAFGLVLLANPALTILSTAEIGQESWKVVPFICLTTFGYAVYGYGADLFLVQRKTRPIAFFMITAAAVNALGNFLLIPRYGILGAAVATLIAYAVMAALSMGMSRRFFTFPVEWTFIGKALLASMVMSVFLWFFRPIQIWEVILSIFIGAVIYFIVLFLIKGFKKEEIEFARRFLRIKGRT